MNKLITWALAAAGALATAQSNASDLLPDSLHSTALGAELKFNIYLPDAYKDAPPTARFPVVYLLHGAGGNETDWAQQGGAVQTLDGLIKRGLIRPVIAVMPTTGPHTWWVDSGAAKARTALMNELLPYVDGKYRTVAERNGRAVAGLSMGGYGALNLALRHPDKFCAAGLLSAAVYEPLPPETSAARRSPAFQREGRFDPEAWRAQNHPALLARYSSGPQRVPMWITSGDHDALGIALASAQLYWRLLKIQPQLAELRIVDGDHEWLTFRDALPEALQYMDRACAKAP
ncbi:alpha/beta hydrolase [Roseateles paludis]|jgi:enterochelin esterase-like enzyme|uniref:Alpha/beta hydrolase-fold protein n=1 Tax=Roseateles paludis TaxID=3145238 RepID=A0ABV0FX69_9BURK